MALRALLLDFDGTMGDSLPLLIRAYEQFVEGLGGTPSPGEFESLNGPPLHEVVDRLCRTHQGRASSAADLRTYEAAVDAGFPWVAPAPGLSELLKRARELGLLVAVVTSNSTARVTNWLEANRFAHLVDAIVCGDEVREGKPSPEPYLRALEKLDVSANDALAIEDGYAGVRSAQSAGIRAVQLAPGGPDAGAIGSLVDAIPLIEAAAQ